MKPKPVYDEAGITIYHGDNCDVMGTLPKESIDLVVTSPPYDDLRTYGGHGWDFYGVAWHLKRLLRPGGVIVWIVADATTNGSETGSSADQAAFFRRLGLLQHDTMIWHKVNAMPLNGPRYESAFEFMFVFSAGPPGAWNPLKEKSILAGVKCTGTQVEEDGTRKPKTGNGRTYNDYKVRQNIWPTPVGGSSFGHPAIFPDSIARDHILSWSNEGDTILDCFLGSGTVAKMARDCARKCIGIEIHEPYISIAIDRLSKKVLAFGS